MAVVCAVGSEALLEAPGIGSEFSRREIWVRAIWGIQDFPVTGFGLDIFRRVAGQLFPFYKLVPDTDIASAHNQFLQAATDLGIPGDDRLRVDVVCHLQDALSTGYEIPAFSFSRVRLGHRRRADRLFHFSDR